VKIKFDSVDKSFGEAVALEKVTFKVIPGEFVFLVGPSGAGKTTVFKLILQELVPTKGRVEVGKVTSEPGKKRLKSSDLAKLRRQVGVIFQDFQLLEECTVAENIAAVLDILGIEGEKKKGAIGRALEKVGLSSRENFFPSQLSGGELQRVCLARALVIKPKILLADEPTGNLDPQHSWQLIELLDKINKEGTTVIMATHNFDIVDSLKRRVIRLDRGKVKADKKKGKYEDR